MASAGEVVHHVFPEALTIVNTTLPGHIFYPGNVFRTVVQEGNDIYVVTHGYGTGDYKNIMETFAKPLWADVDQEIRDRLNSPNTYPPNIQSYRDVFPSTNATDVSEAGSNVYDAVLANQIDAANAFRIYNQSQSNKNAPESDWP